MARSGGRTLSSKLRGRLGSKNGAIGNSRLGSGSVHSRLGMQGKNKSVDLKIKRARERVLNNQIQRRKDLRRNKFNERRQGGLDIDANKALRRNDSPVSYRMGNGTVVGGLRSDKLLLQKKRLKDDKYKPSKSNSSRDYSGWESGGSFMMDEHDHRESSQSIISSLANSGLTVSFENNTMQHRFSKDHLTSAGHRTAPSRERYLYENKVPSERSLYDVYSSRAARSAVCVEPVYYDDIYMVTDSSPEPVYHQSRVYLSPEHPTYLRKSQKSSPSPSPPPPKPVRVASSSKKLTTKSSKTRSKQSSKIQMPLVTVLNDKPTPKPHRPTLDPNVQKEIALLQGKPVSKLDNAPGPGLKGFRIIPTQTSTRLSERFTQDKPASVL